MKASPAIYAILLLLAQAAFSAPACQYRVNYTDYVQVQGVYERGTDRFVTNFLDIGNFVDSDKFGSFEITNKYDVPITVNLVFDYSYLSFTGPRIRETSKTNITIPPGGSETVKYGSDKPVWSGVTLYYETINYTFLGNNETYGKTELVSKTEEKCRMCLGKPCIDDGAPCFISTECGGRFCVEHVCNSAPVCFNNDCRCSGGMVQCPDNRSCVQGGVLALGETPVCSMRECISGFTNSSGQCAKTPEMLQAEENAKTEAQDRKNNALFILGGIVLAIAILFYAKLELDRRKFESGLEKGRKDVP